MRFIVAVALGLSLVTPMDTAAGQDRQAATTDPIARAATREAVRLTSVAQGQSTHGAWAHVRKLPVGADITVTLRDSRPGARYFVRADESALVVSSTRFGRVFETFSRTDIAELTSGVSAGGHTALVASLGAVGGFFAGVSITKTKNEGLNGLPGGIGGAVVGGVLGGILGSQMKHRVEEVIYRP
jgi:hypothetical protein